MSAIYELLDIASGNVVADYPSEDDAIAELRQVVARDGLEVVAGFALLRVVDERQDRVAMTDDLVALVTERSTDRPISTARSV